MLIDTNIIIEIARDQAKAKDCQNLINAISQDLFNESVSISRFSLSAIQALINEVAPDLLKELMVLIHLEKIKIFETNIGDDLMILATQKNFNLDFDDALQFLATNRLNTYLVTYDNDFQNSGIQTKTPGQVLEEVLS